MKSKSEFKRGNLKRLKELKTCEGDRIFLIGDWRPLRKEVVRHDNPLFEFGNVFNDGDSDLQDIVRELYSFYFENRQFPLSDFGICGDDLTPQIISFKEKKYVNSYKTIEEIHFINGYNMNIGMEWMLIEIDAVKNRVRVFEADPDCIW